MDKAAAARHRAALRVRCQDNRDHRKALIQAEIRSEPLRICARLCFTSYVIGKNFKLVASVGSRAKARTQPPDYDTVEIQKSAVRAAAGAGIDGAQFGNPRCISNAAAAGLAACDRLDRLITPRQICARAPSRIEGRKLIRLRTTRNSCPAAAQENMFLRKPER